MAKVLRAHGIALCCDTLLWIAVWAVPLLSASSGSVSLVWLWTFRFFSWVALHLISLMTVDRTVQPVLKRWIAVQCLIFPVFESVKLLMSGTFGSASSVPGPEMVVLGTVSSSVACVLWEWALLKTGWASGDKSKEQKKQEARALLMRVVCYSREDYFHLGAAFLFLILAALCETFIPYCVGRVTDVLTAEYQHSSFTWAIGLMMLVSLGSSLFSGLRGGMFMCSLCRLNKRIRHKLFQNLLQQEINFFEENKPGSLTSRLVSDTDKMGRSVAMNVNVLIRSLVKTLGMLTLMLRLSWHLTTLTCVEMPILALLQNTYNTYSQRLSAKLQDCIAQCEQLAASTIKSMRTVRSSNATGQEQRRYEEALAKKLEVQTQKGIYSAVHLLLRRFVNVGLRILMLTKGRELISTGELSIGSLLAFVLYQKDMVSNMRQLLYIYGDMLSTVSSAVKVFQFLDRRPRLREAGEMAPERLEGKLTFDRVSFAYPSCPEKKALKSVCLELKPGKMTALVGPSGGGKSSVVSLLERFYEPQEGEVLLDREPLYRYQNQYIRSKMALVSQDPVLFSGSVRHNIEYGLQDCTMEKVEQAARRANAHEFICQLPNGYDTDVGECGGQLSAGQKQCITIARAIVRNPQILILDEATSCMDVNTQLAIQGVLSGSAGQTVLVVAHRLQTVEKADHIIYMEDGVVMEQGTHQQLMDRAGRYYRLREKLFTDQQDQYI
ncbi:antigen peptide transporter 2 [Chanos chanos]|uniref:Antigen peptide transporter 2 n=1 Tax=Chanos chanos TaxID=29144 RepID=A0A6J2VHA4_CHACN|nr:antigen peptide transporter 2-like [Chanos chanos]